MSYSKPPLFEPPSSWWEELIMPTILGRIGTFESQGFLNVTRQVNILSNFKRVYRQAEESQECLDQMESYQKENLETVVSFKTCIGNFRKDIPDKMSGGSFIKRNCMGREEFMFCSNKLDAGVEKLKSKKGYIEQKTPNFKVVEPVKYNLDQEVRNWEQYQLSPLYDWIEQMTSKQNKSRFKPDISKKIRGRDNLNRFFNQISRMNQDIKNKEPFLDVGALSLQRRVHAFQKNEMYGKGFTDCFFTDELEATIDEEKSKIPKPTND